MIEDIFDNSMLVSPTDNLRLDYSQEYLKCEKGYQPLSSFKDALTYEKNMQPLADHFYKDVLGAIAIKRYDWKDKNGQFMQKHDVDCSIELETNRLNVFWLNVSEKFRQVECGDMCLELWSDFEGKKLGWAVSGEPDYYLYTTPKYFFRVNAGESFNHMMKKITQEITREKIESIFKNKHKYSAVVQVDGHEVTLIKTWTENAYYGICVCVPWKTLFDDYLLDINMYNHSGEKLDINKVYE